MNIGEKEACVDSHNAFCDINMPVLVDNSVHLVSSTSENNTHFNLLMENLKEIEETFADSDSGRLERDILIQIGRLGALKLFHACLSRTLKAPDAKVACPLTKHSKDSPISRPMKSRMDNITVFSGKRSQRKSMRERVAEKVAKISDLPLHSKSVNLVQQLTKSSNPKSRRFAVARNEMEMAKGLKELTNLERIRSALEERIGRGASLTSWARAAGIDEKVLQQRLHFGWHCRDNLLKSARSLVLYIARNYRRRGISLEDLLQVGNMGVLQGAERFDHTRGFHFSTYVQYWIRKSMSSLIAQHSKGIKIPVTLNNIIDQMKKARRSLYKSNGTFLQDEELAKLAGISVASIRLANKCSRAMGSIDQKIGDCMHVKFKEFTPDTTLKTPEEIVMKQHMQEEIQELLEHLHPRERQVLVLRFGLEDGNRRSLEEIGKLFHVSKEWIRKIEKAALTKVRNEELKTRLKHYVEY
eukprot:TRINITY_DN12449_c0_g1_i4.p1 TRINITY_DN12449_c0_g1~~TRINITY_DN12449_c0_g1_i4.p1  ORF type:complete len:470 (-),score=94.04 TRINITY_DN12449_c0_g1_i4:432-1841(-)